MALTREDPHPSIRQFLRRHIRRDELGDEEDIFRSGFVNSMFAMQLVAFVEKQFDFSVTDEDLDIDHFRSVQAIAAFVERKRAQGLHEQGSA